MRGKAHAAQIKAEVIAALLAGQGVGEVARRYELPERTVLNWQKALPPTELAAVGEKRRRDFGDLIADYLAENLLTLQVQARVFRDEEWLKQQDASELAVLHGVLTDKAIRILAAAEQAADRDDVPPAD